MQARQEMRVVDVMALDGDVLHVHVLIPIGIVTLLSPANVESRLFLCIDIVMAARVRRSNPTIRVGISHRLVRFASKLAS
jgi:hypothetical protein